MSNALKMGNALKMANATGDKDPHREIKYNTKALGGETKRLQKLTAHVYMAQIAREDVTHIWDGEPKWRRYMHDQSSRSIGPKFPSLASLS